MDIKNEKAVIKDEDLESVTGGTEPGEWSIPENGLPRPSRNTEPENNTPVWTTGANEEWKAEIPEFETSKPGTYELHGVVWGQD